MFGDIRSALALCGEGHTYEACRMMRLAEKSPIRPEVSSYIVNDLGRKGLLALHIHLKHLVFTHHWWEFRMFDHLPYAEEGEWPGEYIRRLKVDLATGAGSNYQEAHPDTCEINRIRGLSRLGFDVTKDIRSGVENGTLEMTFAFAGMYDHTVEPLCSNSMEDGKDDMYIRRPMLTTFGGRHNDVIVDPWPNLPEMDIHTAARIQKDSYSRLGSRRDLIAEYIRIFGSPLE